MRIGMAAVVMAAVVAACGTAYASIGAPVGVVASTEGVCDVARAGEPVRMLEEKETVCAGDRIRTKSYSKAELRLDDGSVVRIAPGSSLVIEEFSMTGERQRIMCALKLTRGKVEAVVARTGAPETFVVKTPNAESAVRGSDIFVSFLAGKTSVFVAEGAVAVSNPASPAGRTKLLKGDCVYVPFQDPPGAVRPARDSEMARHRKDVTPELIKKWIPSQDSSLMDALVVEVLGTVRVIFNGSDDWQDLRPQDSLSEGDRVQTGEDGTAQIRMGNGNILRVQPNSEVAVEALRQGPGGDEFSNTFTVPYGRVVAVVERLNKRSTFQVKTPTVVCGVRGTILDVFVPPASMAGAAVPTQVFFEGGSGTVTNMMTGQVQQVDAGHFVTVDVGGTISPPVVSDAGPYPAGMAPAGQGQPGPRPNLPPPGMALKPGPQQPPPPGELPPPPPPPPPLFDPTLQPLLPPPIITSTLPYDEVIRIPPPEAVLYDRELLPYDRTGLVINPGSSHLYVNNDGTWVANIINGQFNGAVGTWSLTHTNVQGDVLYVYGTDFPTSGTWTGTVGAGSVAGGTDPDKILTGTATGTNTPGTTGEFIGRAEGTWTDVGGMSG